MRNPNNSMLALRDAAVAAAMGAIPGADFGQEYGVNGPYRFQGDFGEDLIPTAANMQKALAEKTATRMREGLLNPNANSLAKIQRYTFAVNEDLTIGTASNFTLTGKPQTQFRPQRMTANVPQGLPGVIYYSFMQVANVGLLVGGIVDASDFAKDGVDQALDVPTLSPQNEVNISGNITTLTPSEYAAGAFKHALSFKGPATMAGG